MVFRLKIYKAILVFIISLILFISTAEAVKGDKRIIKTFTLENGLDVFLVSDPDVHRSAAALAVGVGHLYDPKEKQGLAHYLCLLYTSPSPRDLSTSRMPSSA